MVFVLIVDTIQPTATTICQIIYLCTSASVSDPTTSKQAKALFIGNILVSVTTVILSVIILVAKRKVFKDVDAQIKLRKSQSAELAPTFDHIYSLMEAVAMTRSNFAILNETCHLLRILCKRVKALEQIHHGMQRLGFRLQRRAFVELSESISNAIQGNTGSSHQPRNNRRI